MSYQHRVYRGDGTYWVSESRDDTTRTVTTYDESGAVTSTRPYTADENAAAEAALAEEAAREERRIKAERDQAILDATAALMADAHEDGAAWVQPTGAHNAYPLGRTVTWGGKTWENITPANVWEPPTGWREQVAEGYPEWVRPTGSHDAYTIGDRVAFEGSNYESTINANTWSPTEYPAGWTLIP